MSKITSINKTRFFANSRLKQVNSSFYRKLTLTLSPILACALVNKYRTDTEFGPEQHFLPIQQRFKADKVEMWTIFSHFCG